MKRRPEGPVLNMVPRAGGNSMTGSFYAGWGPEALQGTNLTDELKAAGATAPTPLIKNYDVSAAVGGPIRAGSLVVLGSTRRQGTAQLFDMYYNQNQGPRTSGPTPGRPSATRPSSTERITTSSCASRRS